MSRTQFSPEVRSSARALSILAIALLAIGCTAPAAQVSLGPSATTEAPTTASPILGAPTPTSAAPRTPTPPTPPTPTSAPSASPPVSTGFQYADILRIEVDGLAVREEPSLTSPLAQGYRAVGGTAQPIGDVRLDAGYFVSVHLGPLRSGDTDWYLVWPAVDARLHYNPGPWWDSNGDFATVGGVDPGWVAGSVGEDQYVTLYRRPEPGELDQSFVMVSGTGDYESEPQPRHDLWGFNWAVAVNDNPSPCAFSVTLVPAEGGAEPVVAVETSTIGVEQGPVTGPGSSISMPWGPSAGGSWSSFAVSIKSGCTWAVGLWLHGHD